MVDFDYFFLNWPHILLQSVHLIIDRSYAHEILIYIVCIPWNGQKLRKQKWNAEIRYSNVSMLKHLSLGTFVWIFRIFCFVFGEDWEAQNMYFSNEPLYIRNFDTIKSCIIFIGYVWVIWISLLCDYFPCTSYSFIFPNILSQKGSQKSNCNVFAQEKKLKGFLSNRTRTR